MQNIPATKQQKQAIHMNVPAPIKEEMVQWATDDNSKTSCNDLSFDQANEILKKFGKEPHKLVFWAWFDSKNPKHNYITVLCREYGWRKYTKQYGWVADMDKLNEWLYTKSPVKKALKSMTPAELSKVIAALENMSLKQNSKPPVKLC